ncbi:MAG: hypothetical protein PHG91_03375 [Syntrophales bacterium]|nr:hypothetical protein [Syntrophales bacterium]
MMERDGGKFEIGVNYWPIRKGMALWRSFDPGEVREDFARMRDWDISPARIFLLWEDFQPEPERVGMPALNRLVQLAGIASDARIPICVTLFTGHMSGANWLPGWMVLPGESESRFPVITRGRSGPFNVRNPYLEREVRDAQKILIRETCAALRGYAGLWGWDLGNEPSNVYRPTERGQGRTWIGEMTEELLRLNPAPVTIGLHQEDIEQNRGMGPEDAAQFCDLITMHAYPAYSSWSGGKTDPLFPLFMAEMARWLSGRSEVWMAEMGVSTGSDAKSVSEEEAAVYAGDSLDILRRAGIPGALWWCYGDYSPDVCGAVPFRDLPHECCFGLFRSDGSPKEILDVIRRAERTRIAGRPDLDWIDVEPREYRGEPEMHIRRLYRRFRELNSSEP